MKNNRTTFLKAFESVLPLLNRTLAVCCLLTLAAVTVLFVQKRFAGYQLTLGPEKTNLVQTVGDIPALDEKQPLVEQERRAEQLMKRVLTPHQLSHPDTQKILDILGTSEYQRFIDTSPSGILEYVDFFARHGVNINRQQVIDEYEAEFRSEFPETTVQELMPEMQQSLSEVFRQFQIEPETPAGLTAFTAALEEFLSDEKNVAWMNMYFQGDTDKFSEWTVSVLEKQIDMELHRQQTLNPDIQHSQTFGMEKYEQNELPPQGIVELTRPKHATDTALSENVDNRKNPSEKTTGDTDLDNLFRIPTEKELETTFRDSFSEESIADAIRMMNQHGANKGIHEIRKKNPQLADRIKELQDSEVPK